MTLRGGGILEAIVNSLDAVLEPVLTRHRREPSQLLQILREVQEQVGHLPAPALTAIAQALQLPR
ncbi:MAG TPA: NAD(P)H-dependent oxidoreductase subunit E, partial [Azospira sp.]|nr:NAD(P)H-dependent oxidoreductase subunit E [Azospira sp.]